MSLTRDMTKHLAHLARIRLSDQEQIHLTRDMQSIVHFIDQLGQVDLSRLRPAQETQTLIHPEFMPMEEDAVRDQVGAARLLDQAPQQACDMFVVPKMVE